MKKLIAGCLTILMTAGIAFAVDFSASVYMLGTLASGSGDGSTINGPTVNNQAQKDADMLVFNIDGGNFGAHFELWTNLASTVTYLTQSATESSTGKDKTSTLDNAVYARRAYLWFKPVTQLKIAVGNVGSYLYTEQLHWWKTGLGASASGASGWNLRYSNYTGVEGGGINITYNPIKALTIDLGTGGGFGNALWTKSGGNFTYTDWGTTVKYQINNTFSAGIGWRDMGSDGSTKPDNYSMKADDDYYKVLSIGVDGKTDNMYGFLQPRILLNEYYGFEGVTFDNYFRYAKGPVTFEARVPFTYRQQDSGEVDPSYLIYELRVKYAANDTITPFLDLSNDDGGDYTPLCFGTDANGNSFADTFVVHVYPGVFLKFGNCIMDVGVSFNTYKKDSTPSWGWTVPFEARVTF
jgi:hypothetical protein